MPALKMKSKSSKECIRVDKLHACLKSSKISKGSHFEAKASQLSDDTSTQVPLDDSVVEVSGEDIHTTEVIQQEDSFLQASTPLLKLPSSLPDVTSADRNGSLAVGCQSILETIFSPILDHGDVQGTLIDNNIEDKEQADLPHLVPDDSDDGSCTSCDFQSCNVIDYCISDSSDPLAFSGSMGFSDAISGSCSDYDNADYDMMFDLPERYMILPFVERTRQDSNFQYDDSIEEAAVNSDDSCLYLAIHQLKSSDEDIGCHSWDVEDLGSFDPQLFIKNLPDLPEAVSSLWPMLLPKETRKRKAITLVLDLDETLVHSTLEYCADADFTFPVFFNMKEHTVYVRQRPYLHIFLERVAQMFEIVIFTASQSIYAEQLLDILDPGKKLISRRIYRESCIFSEGSYIKDLTILGVDLAKVFIIDNSPQVFRLQVNNGIPIKSWFDDPSDCALISLLPFLESLVDVDDVRPLIAERFNKE